MRIVIFYCERLLKEKNQAPIVRKREAAENEIFVIENRKRDSCQGQDFLCIRIPSMKHKITQ